MTRHSTKKPVGNKARKKPKKPHRDFPLTANGNGQWSKKIRGKVYYFGVWEDADGALQQYLDQKDDLLAGRTPRQQREGITVVELANRFLTAKDSLVRTGELSRRSWNDYSKSCEQIIECFGRNRLVEDLTSSDFESLRKVLSKSRGPITLGNEIQRARVVFNYGFEAELIKTPVRFGPTFKRPGKKIRRRIRNERGPLLFEADEIRSMLSEASIPVKAMILLGINCGLGNYDVSSLRMGRVNLDTGWHDFGRPKTGIERRCPLWPETINAVRHAVEKRRMPAAADYEDYVFLTVRGRPWVRLKDDGKTWVDGISQECGKLLRALEIKRHGVNFYTLRRTFRTVGDEAGDQPAVNFIMGHADNDGDMASVYRQKIDDDRLHRVVDYVRDWLWSDEG